MTSFQPATTRLKPSAAMCRRKVQVARLEKQIDHAEGIIQSFMHSTEEILSCNGTRHSWHEVLVVGGFMFAEDAHKIYNFLRYLFGIAVR